MKKKSINAIDYHESAVVEKHCMDARQSVTSQMEVDQHHRHC